MDDIFEVRNSSKFGRQLIALKNFKEGDLVYIEDPLLVFPDFKSSPNLVEDLVICMGCYMIFPISEVVKCPECEWNLCSLNCAQEDFHKNYECEYLAEHRVTCTRENAVYAGVMRLIICWQRRTGKFDKWRAFWNLSPNYGEPTEELNSAIKDMCKSANDFVTSELDIRIDKHLVDGIVKRILVNSFSTFDRDELGIPYAAEVIFENCSLLAHSCAANMDWSLAYSHTDRDGQKDIRWKMRLFAKLDIKKGDHLTIPYMQNYMERGMMERQGTIFEFFHFLCRCPRCCDPSEMGTYFSGILCTKCDSGILLPEYPLNWNTDWVCNKCTNRMTVEKVESLEEKFDHTLAKFIVITETDHKTGINKVDNLIEWASTIYHLHPNHNLVIRAIHHYLISHDLEILLEDSPESLKTYENMIERANRSIKIGKEIGTSDNWGVMEGTIAMVIIRYKFKSNDYETIVKDNYSTDEKRNLLEEIVTHIENALNLMERLPYTKMSWPVRRVLKHRYNIWNMRLVELNKARMRIMMTMTDSDSEPGIKNTMELRDSGGRTLINAEAGIVSYDHLHALSRKKETFLRPVNDKAAKLKGMVRRMATALPRKINRPELISSMAVGYSINSITNLTEILPELQTQSDDVNVTVAAWKRNTEEILRKLRPVPKNNFVAEEKILLSDKSKKQNVLLKQKVAESGPHQNVLPAKKLTTRKHLNSKDIKVIKYP